MAKKRHKKQTIKQTIKKNSEELLTYFLLEIHCSYADSMHHIFFITRKLFTFHELLHFQNNFMIKPFFKGFISDVPWRCILWFYSSSVILPYRFASRIPMKQQ